MRIEYLEYIITTAQSKSISSAADRLFLSQTTLSSIIKSVETELGITLFNRGRSGITLTDAGERFIPLAESIVDKYVQMQHISSEGDYVETLRLAAHPVACERYSIRLVDQMRRETSKVSLAITEISRKQIMHAVANGEYRYGIGYMEAKNCAEYSRQAKNQGLILEPLTQDRRYLYVTPESPFAGREQVSIHELHNIHLAVTEWGVAEYLQDGLEGIISHYTVFSNAHLSKRAVELYGMSAIYTSDDKTPDWFIEGSNLCKVPVTELTDNKLQHYLLYREKWEYRPSERTLFHCIRNLLRQDPVADKN